MSDQLDDDIEAKLDQALLDFMRRFDTGQISNREVFLEEYAEIAPQLRTLLDAADLIEKLAGPTLSEITKSTAISQNDQQQPEEHVEALGPNAATLPLKGGENTGPVATSPYDSTLPPAKSQSEFSLSSLGNTNNSQSNLPYRFGDYILEQVLGRGGMGVVYLAFQVQLERRVAIKMIRSGCLASNEEVDRFHMEARSAASLTHPNIVTVYQCGECDGHHYFSMDYIPGTDLAKRISTGPMRPTEAVRYVRDVARAIDYAH
ncbi:MAG TPA: serine/threonine-protein kinase, partial [Pirellula sp.]|nr:serine/threonine-protein kinase [Pirellula sp.]